MAIGRSNMSMSPDECKKRQSGFWTHEYRPMNNEEVWRCDRHKLDEAVRTVMMDYRESMVFQKDPHHYLDTRFGEGTAYVYFSKHKNDNPYVDLRTPRHIGIDMARGEDMALTSYASMMSGNTFTNTTTTSGTSGASDMYWIRDEMQKHVQRAVEKHVPYKRTPSINRLVRLPFKVETGGDLLSSLQREFDRWAAPEMRAIHG